MEIWNAIVAAITFKTIILAIFLVILGMAFYQAHKRTKDPIDWIDMLLDKNSNRVSISKVGQFVGLIVSSWVVISMASSNNLNYDIFGIYLAFSLGGAMFSTFVKGKYNMSDPPKTPRPKIDNPD